MTENLDEYGLYKEQAQAHPKLRPVFRFVIQLSKESDRGLVLIASGYIEEMLKSLLEHFLVEHKDMEGLFDGTMPLGTLSGRIKMCFGLGLLTELEYKSLDQIRRIRNDFAHDPDVGFHTEKIINRCRNLKLDDEKPEKSKEEVTERNRFTAVAIAIMLYLGFRMDKVEKVRRTEWTEKTPSIFDEPDKGLAGKV